ncbi:MAG: tyrosine-type recombinase/integrase [Candidatus Marinimicrobia bacterium]|nr:tyrosine-type recombinase/integrase [Candidatus Neomarinimicrobiota bacterium]
MNISYFKHKFIIHNFTLITRNLSLNIAGTLTCAPKTKKNHLNCLAQVFDQAIKEDILKSNPARLATLPKIPKVIRHRLMTQEDIEIIFKGAGSWKLYYLYLYYTGLRAGDAAMLTYGNLDRSRKVITNYIRKSRRIHEFPLADELMRATPDDLPEKGLFPSLAPRIQLENGIWITNEKKLHHNLSKPRKFMQALLAAAGRPKATLHSFRVTYNNSLRDLGLSIQDRQVLLAHSSTSTTQIYTHPNIELAREYVNRLPSPTNTN